MAKIIYFEDIEAWQKSRLFVKNTYEVTGNTCFNKDYGVKSQIQRASVSVMSNIAEGFERNSRKEFIRFLYISRASAAEVRSLLYVAKDLNYIDEKLFREMFNAITIISKQLYRLIEYLKKCS